MDRHTALEELTRKECVALLRTRRVGRVGLTMAALPAVLPVNYTVLNEEVIFRTMPGTKFTAAALNAVVAFEVDDADETSRTGWSVLVVGHAREITDPDELEAVRGLPLDSWIGNDAGHVVAIRAQRITGRRIVRAAAASAS